MPNESVSDAPVEVILAVLLQDAPPVGAFLMGSACALCGVAKLVPSRALLEQCREIQTTAAGIRRIEQWIKASVRLRKRQKSTHPPAAAQS